MYTIGFLDGRIEEFDSLENCNLKGADLRDVSLIRANLKGSILLNADLSGVNLRGANLRFSDLRSANLKRADLRGVDLVGANLASVNLIGADLVGANLVGSRGIISGIFGKHLAVAFTFEEKAYIKIGCLTKESFEWLECFKNVGLKYDYNKFEILLYGNFIKMVYDNQQSLFE